MNSLSHFEFIVSVVIAQFMLGYMRPLSILLQAIKCDLVEAHRKARTLADILQILRTNETISNPMSRATALAESVGTTPFMKRQTSVQRHRANAQPQVTTDAIEDSYRVNMFFPYLDHVVQHLNSRFPPELKAAMYGCYLIPSCHDKLDTDVVGVIHEEYKLDLPATNFDHEVHRWIEKYRTQPPNERPDTLDKSLKECLPMLFPNINAILSLLLTLPVGSCSCERSFSVMKVIKTVVRSSVTQARFCGLAMAYIHRAGIVPHLDPVMILRRCDSSETGASI